MPGSSPGKESACDAVDPGPIPWLGRSTGEGIGYPLHYSWASLVAQLVKNLPAVVETWVWSLGWEDPLEKGKATHSSILAWRIPWTCIVYGVAESDTTEGHSLSLSLDLLYSLLEENGFLQCVCVCVYTHVHIAKYIHVKYMYTYMEGWWLGAKFCPTLATPWTVACEAPLSMGFPRQEYWSGLPFPSLGDLPNLGIEPRSPQCRWILHQLHTKWLKCILSLKS